MNNIFENEKNKFEEENGALKEGLTPIFTDFLSKHEIPEEFRTKEGRDKQLKEFKDKVDFYDNLMKGSIVCFCVLLICTFFTLSSYYTILQLVISLSILFINGFSTWLFYLKRRSYLFAWVATKAMFSSMRDDE
jgi:hypothetical protein